jgi:protein-disulfide isomerase
MLFTSLKQFHKTLISLIGTGALKTTIALVFVISNTVQGQTNEPVVATVNGQTISARQIDDLIVSQILPLQQQIYAIRKTALENVILRTILEGEARRKGISVEELKKQFMAGPVEVTTSQVEQLYQENAAVFAMMSPDEAKEKLRLDLEGQARLKKYRAAISALRETFKIEILLAEPRLPPVNSFNAFASTGPPSARVVITEFSDFECPYCKQVQGTIKAIMKDYPNDVRLMFKQLPLGIHPSALVSAQAAFCAGEQGVFWQYHDALFDSPTLEIDTFEKLAQRVGADLAKFKLCLASDQSRTAVLNDIREAQRLGINSTPTFLINGKVVRGAISLAELKSIVERELNNTHPVLTNNLNLFQ